MATQGMFELDADGEAGGRANSELSSDLPASGTITPTNGGAKSEVELSRKAIPVIEVEKDVCSICLDEFSDEDPGIPTHCGHRYHLQCIMQWAQRSRECPMCFHELRLQDPNLHEMLPFGEYISPQQAAAATASMESWDLERLLVQLAAANHRHERRAAREARHRRRTTGGGIEPSAAQPIRPVTSDGGIMVGTGCRRTVVAFSNGDSDQDLLHLGSQELPSLNSASPSASAAFPASWPPSGSRTLAAAAAHASVGDGASGSGTGLSPGLKAASLSIKKGFAALKLRESLSKTTKEIKSLFTHSNSAGPRPDRPADGADT